MNWYQENLKFYNEEKNRVKENYPDLKFFEKSGTVYLIGKINITNNNQLLDTYKIEIEFPDNYPKKIPIMREVGGRIPRTRDHHINPDDSCCMYIRCEEKKYFHQRLNITHYFKNLVIPFLANQSFYERYGEWCDGEFKHGVDGIVQFYKEKLITDDLEVIMKVLYFILKRKKLLKKDVCFCGSGKSFERCHRKQCKDLKIKISEETLYEDYLEIKSIYKN